MLSLKPEGRIDLDHRAIFLRTAQNGSLVIAAAKNGECSLLTSDLSKLEKCRLPSKVRALVLHPSGQQLAWVDDTTGSVEVQDLAGSRHLEITPPQVTDTKPEWIRRGFDDCCFSDDGNFLWTTAPLNATDVVVQLRHAETGMLVDTATVQDPFGGSSCSFHSTGKPDIGSFWMAAGNPDMVQVYWLQRNGTRFACTIEVKLRNAIPPVFSPNGGELLVVNADQAICKFDYPTMQQVGLPLMSGDEDNPFVESLCYLNDRQALASTNEQRIFAVDTDQMKIETEVFIDGHEPRPIGVYYPNLSKEGGLGTDISWFTRLGDFIVFVYRRDRSTGLEGWNDTLLWLRAK
jgi:WD40 repeat protein